MGMRHRLAIGFGSVIMILVFMCAIAFLNAHQSLLLIRSSMAQAQEKLNLAYRIQGAVQRQDVAVRNAGLFGEPQQIAAESATARAMNKEIDAHLRDFTQYGIPADERATLDLAITLNRQIAPVVDKALAAAATLDWGASIKAIGAEFAPLSEKRSAAVETLAQAQQKVVEAALSQMVASAARARIVAVAGAVAGLLGALVCAVLVSRSITLPLGRATTLAERVAEGDLSGELLVDTTDEIGKLLAALERMRLRLREIISAVRNTAEMLLVSSGEIAAGSMDLSRRTERDAAGLQASAATLRGLSETVSTSAEASRQADRLAIEALRSADLGGRGMAALVRAMEAIDMSSRKSAEVVSVIDSLAFQTNILAINAAVEASAAGDRGRGFSIVASEVRKLSRLCADSAKEISVLVQGNVEKVKLGLRDALTAEESFRQTTDANRRVAQLIAQISESSERQAEGLTEVAGAVLQVELGTQQSAAMVEQSAASAQGLRQLTEALNRTVEQFRL